SEGELTLGSALAEKLGAKIGSEVRVIIPFGESAKKEGGDAPLVLKSTVVGIVRMGMYDYDSKFIFLALPVVQKFLKQEGKITSFKIRLKPGSNAQAVSERLGDNFGFPFRAKYWAQLNKNLFYAVKLEKIVILIILTCIVLVAAFNVVSTLMMMIHDKTKEIAILKAMGFRQSQSFGLFCLIGVGMGLVGTVFGSTLGVLSNWLLGKSRLIQLPPDVYYIGFLPVVTEWREVAMIAFSAVGISFLATLYPAWKVARRAPLEGIRYDS
ncbi:MAG: FtsX-like permease family protein, partial [Bdellovibrionota bacterium]